ncbi:MAG: ion channel [Acidobacteriota bacterium]|nr:ion channel [Acidobacteriota bacterium]
MTKQTFDPGLTNQYGGEMRRTIDKDGSFNVRRRGGSGFNFYLFLIDTTWPKFIAVVGTAYFIVNLVFAGLFVAAGTDHLYGANTNTGLGPFLSAFFFSVHTLTTVGYGSMYPTGLAANIIAAMEAMTGLMGFALATGLLYGRFSRPSAKIVFSDVMLIAPYQDGASLQFRIANERDNVLLELEASVLMMYVDKTESEPRRKFIGLTLERSTVYFFPLTWTVVHPIIADSPIYQKTAEDLAKMEAEFLILVKAFDDTFSQTVHARYSYRHEEIVWGARFQPAFFVDSTGDMVLELNRVNDRKLIETPARIS